MIRSSRLLCVLTALLLLATPAFADGEDPVADGDVPRLGPVVVTETRTERAVEDLSGSADVVDREEIRRRGIWNLEEAVEELPGVEVVGNSRYGQEVRLNMRGVNSGYGTQRTLVLLDGRPLTDEYLGNVDLAQYPLFAMDRLELIRGPASSAYGTNAMGGVANLIPRRGGPDRITEITTELGSFGTRRAGVRYGNQSGPVDFLVAGHALDTDGYLRNSRGDPMDWQTCGGFANVGYSEDRFDARAYLSWFDGEGTDEDFDRELDRNLADLKFTFDTDPEHDAVTGLRLYRSSLDEDLNWFERPVTKFDQVSWGAILTQTWRVHPDHLMLGGLEWRRESAEVSEAAGPVDETATTWSAFLQDEIDLCEDATLTLGVRYDDRTHIDGEFSWRTGLNWRVAEGTTLRGALGRAFRAPTISDQFLPTTGYFGLTFEGNPDLDPEVLRSGELGVDQRLCECAELSFTAFMSRYKDFWDFLPDTDGVFRPMNIAGVRIRGLEAEVTADLGEGFTARAGYTFTDAEYRHFRGNPGVEGNRIDDNVAHRGGASLTWQHTDGHAARVGAVFSGRRVTDPENSAEGTLDNFVVLEVAVLVRITDEVEFTLSVQNALNRGYDTRPEYREPGRAFFGGLRFTF